MATLQNSKFEAHDEQNDDFTNVNEEFCEECNEEVGILQRCLIKIAIIGCVILPHIPTAFAQNRLAGTDSATKDLITTFGSDIENLKDRLDEQSKIVDRIVTDQQRDNKQMLNVMESIVDRLDRIDKNMRGMEDKINKMDFKN
jgi:hypothetical protein